MCVYLVHIERENFLVFTLFTCASMTERGREKERVNHCEMHQKEYISYHSGDKRLVCTAHVNSPDHYIDSLYNPLNPHDGSRAIIPSFKTFKTVSLVFLMQISDCL